MTAAGMELFKTRDKANEGKKLPLYAPDGSPTDHWLQVRHVWSDAFQEANEAVLGEVRDTVLAAEGDNAKISAAKVEAKFKLWATLVSGWSFDTECTPEAVQAFLRDSPQIGPVLDKFAADSRLFFGNDSISLESGSSQSES
ncbi:hypothetical protein CSC70_06310 [Pseudoxanthomonas kalamensis DSM 18571]|uniref:hypothetical protein n=1 Tax=Pseudoxanthomonas kalamensis TaxID=289483 RepID=UPI0013913509|nr:hypothetical protein [Pseudoxanthomonas kalamensis]KAF1710303.1 hypothetical protein CSC70_06310 [Pseudoxanthomonas kalamensis DSM 18571]